MKKNWSNTTLVAYPLLPKIVENIDNGVKIRVNSSFQSKHLQLGISNERLIGEILDLNEEKRKIVNLRYIVSTSLDALKDKYKSVLIDRLMNKKTFQQIAEENHLSIRTVFRRFLVAEESYAKILESHGFGENYLEKEYGDDKYISKVHTRVMRDGYFTAKSQ